MLPCQRSRRRVKVPGFWREREKSTRGNWKTHKMGLTLKSKMAPVAFKGVVRGGRDMDDTWREKHRSFGLSVVCVWFRGLGVPTSGPTVNIASTRSSAVPLFLAQWFFVPLLSFQTKTLGLGSVTLSAFFAAV